MAREPRDWICSGESESTSRRCLESAVNGAPLDRVAVTKWRYLPAPRCCIDAFGPRQRNAVFPVHFLEANRERVLFVQWDMPTNEIRTDGEFAVPR